MKWYGWVILVFAGACIGLIAFAAARNTFNYHGLGDRHHGGHNTLPLTQWLEVSTTQEHGLTAADPKFSEDAAKLAQAVRQERQKLLDVLADPASTKEQINAQVEQVLAAEAALQRRVTQYVIEARSVLSLSQQQRLLGLYGQAMGSTYRGGHESHEEQGEHGGRGGGGHGGGGHHGGHE